MTVYVDTNVILRYLLGDHRDMSSAATELFRQAGRGEIRLRIEPIILAECCCVLQGKIYARYFPSRHSIADPLIRLILLPGVESDNPVWLIETL